jgi:hypothetical protein
VVDLTAVDYDALVAGKLAPLALLPDRVHPPDLYDRVAEQVARAGPDDRAHMVELAGVVLHRDRRALDTLIAALKGRGMDSLLRETDFGRQLLHEGREEGREEGRAQERAAMARALVVQRFGDGPSVDEAARALARLGETDLVARVFGADSVTDLLS